MIISATRRIQFCAGHRVLGHENKCSNMHGHNYVALFHARAATFDLPGTGGAGELDSLGRVIDFGVLKSLVGTWIERFWDHAFIYHGADHEVFKALDHIQGQRGYAMRDNPTAENMAAMLLNEVCPALLQGYPVEVWKVTLWETENCFAEASLYDSY